MTKFKHAPEYGLTVFATFDNEEDRENYMREHVIPHAIPNGGKVNSWSEENEGHYRDLCEELLEALKLLSEHTAIWNNPCTPKDAKVNKIVSDVVAKAEGR